MAMYAKPAITRPGRVQAGTARIHLVWLGNDDRTVRIEHDLSSGYFRQERYETATVSGTVQLGPAPLWDELMFTGDDAHDAKIATASEISLP